MKSKITTNLPFIIASLILLITVTGCKQIDKLTQFNMSYDEVITIESNTGVNLPFNISTPPIESNSSSVFELNNTHKDLIERINLKTLELTLVSPSSGNFNFLESISIFIEADGLSEIEIAWKESIPDDNSKTLILETTDADLKGYIKMDKFSLRLKTVTDELITSDHEIDLHSVFFVDAKILGQ